MGRNRTQLQHTARAVVDFADKVVAHLMPGDRPPLTFGELDAAIDLVGQVFQRYAGLLTNIHYELTPVVEPWYGTFATPLFRRPAGLSYMVLVDEQRQAVADLRRASTGLDDVVESLGGFNPHTTRADHDRLDRATRRLDDSVVAWQALGHGIGQ